MWSTSLSCLYSLDALNAKKRCGIVYFQWTNFFQCCVFLTTLVLFCELSYAQDFTTEYLPGSKGNSTAEEDLISDEYVKIRPYYNEHGNLKLNITLDHFSGRSVRGYNISVNRIGPPLLKRCYKVLQNYEILRNDSFIRIPNTEVQYNILLSKCKYEIVINPLPISDHKVLKINYTIPGTSVIRNIAAFTFYDNESNGIKINITWDNPTEPVLPTEYQIKISPFNENKDHCDANSQFQELYKPAKVTSVVFPKDIIPGCSYTIEVVEQPTNDLDPPRINYTVPDCVDEHCMCHYIKPYPPQPNITVQQISKDVIRIFWKIPKSYNIDNLTKIMFRVDLQQHAQSVLHERNITDQDVDTEMEENVTVPGMLLGALYVVQAWYVNASYCKSSQTRLYYYAQPISEQHMKIEIILITVFILMIISAMYFLWKRRFELCFSSHWICYRLRGQRTVTNLQLRRIDSTTDGGRTRPYLAVPMEYNNLYIEKEIADEQERGKVDKYEVSYTRLQFAEKIGNGAFGQVFLARATAIAGIPGCSHVAVKKLEKNASAEEQEDFLLEIAMFKQIGQHPNIVTLLGCCTLRQPYCMIMEYVPCGDLLHYLRTLRLQYEQKDKAYLFTVNKSFDSAHLHSREKQKGSDASYITPESIPSNRLPSVTETEYTLLGSDILMPTTPVAMTSRNPAVLECVLDTRELQNFALQIARGMQHLERKQIVHRDLAARNVLIDENKTLKISDFGLSRSGIYVNSKQTKVPLRWLSVEAIRDHLYTNKSDVWAYGIVLWEIGTLGGFPYPTVSNDDILGYLLQGKRLEKPENCTDELYDLMHQCWFHEENQRPSFLELVEYLETISNKRRVYVDFSQLNPSYMFPPTEEQTITQLKSSNVKTIEIVLTDKDK